MPETPPQTDTYNTALDIFDKTHPLRVDADENLKVTVIGPVTLAAEPFIDIGKVDQGVSGTDPWLVKIDQSSPNNIVIVAPIRVITTDIFTTTGVGPIYTTTQTFKSFAIQV